MNKKNIFLPPKIENKDFGYQHPLKKENKREKRPPDEKLKIGRVGSRRVWQNETSLFLVAASVDILKQRLDSFLTVDTFVLNSLHRISAKESR